MSHRFLLPSLLILFLSTTACQSSKDSAITVNEQTELLAELYIMVRVNKSEKGLKLVASEKKINDIVNPRHSAPEPDNNAGDTFRCELKSAHGTTILSRTQQGYFNLDQMGSVDAVVTFFMPYTGKSDVAIVSYQVSEGIWQEIYRAELP